MPKPLISITVPAYNEEKVLPLFHKEISKIAAQMEEDANFEFIFINDGSKDKTAEVLKTLAAKDKRIKYITFSRNFGKEAAILAGLTHTKGDYVVLMDADLQDPPSKLPEMFKAVTEEDYDAVGLRRVTRKGEPIIRSFFARRFYKLINRMSKVEMVDGARDYRIMTRPVADALISIPEYNRYTKGLMGFVGFKIKWLEYENVERAAGETHWSFWKLFAYAIEGIVSFSTAPLVIAAILGILLCLAAVAAIIFIIIRALAFGDPVPGWPSLVCTILFVGGAQLLATGILGEYLAKTYLETKRRPIYIIDHKRSHGIKNEDRA